MRSWTGRLLIPALIGTVAGCGGVEVSGIVRDRETGEPLPGAIVGIGDAVTRTDGGGNYELEVDLDDDDRPVRAFANAPGYQSSTEFMGSHDDRDEVYRDFELSKNEARRQQEQQKLQEQRELRRQQQQWQQERSGAQERQGQPAAEITTDEAGAIIIVPKAKQEEPQLYEGTIELRPSEEQQQQGQRGQQGQEQQQQQQQPLDEQEDLQDDEGAFESR